MKQHGTLNRYSVAFAALGGQLVRAKAQCIVILHTTFSKCVVKSGEFSQMQALEMVRLKKQNFLEQIAACGAVQQVSVFIADRQNSRIEKAHLLLCFGSSFELLPTHCGCTCCDCGHR